MASQALPLLTPERYLEIERAAEYKSEYWGGEMFAMAGVSEPHTMITGNIFVQLRQQLRSTPCRAYVADLRVRAGNLFTYPDVVVVCDAPQLLDSYQDTLINPALIVEVLSPSTEAYDRGRKFEHYRSIDSLRQYLLVAQDRVQADLFIRQAGGQWVLISFSQTEDYLPLDSIGCRLSLAESYEKVEFSSQG